MLDIDFWNVRSQDMLLVTPVQFYDEGIIINAVSQINLNFLRAVWV